MKSKHWAASNGKEIAEKELYGNGSPGLESSLATFLINRNENADRNFKISKFCQLPNQTSNISAKNNIHAFWFSSMINT